MRARIGEQAGWGSRSHLSLVRRGRKRAGRVTGVVCLLAAGLGFVTSTATTANASIGSDRSQIRQIEGQIEQEGELVQSLVQRENMVRLRLNVVRARIATEESALRKDESAQAEAASHLRTVAMNTYVDAASGSLSNPLLGSSSASAAAEQQVYSGVAGDVLDNALASYKVAEHRTTVTASSLRTERSHLAETLSRLTTSQQQADAALERENSTLSRLKGNLVAQIVAAEQRAEAAKEAAEERHAAAEEEAQQAQQEAQPPAPAQPASPPAAKPAPVSGTYGNPLRAISGLTPERVDQGVDYCGYGPIYAVGDGVVLMTVNGGWPGGTFIAYRLTDGPASGLVVYAAEDIQPEVSVGQTVTPNTVLGQMYEGPDGIETGWADGSALGETMAMASGQFSGANSTAFGYNFSQLLQSLGAPGGILQNTPPTGSLPGGWPSW